MANVTSGWRIPQLAFERGEWEGERDSQLIEVTSNTWQLPHPPTSPLAQLCLISEQFDH